MSHAPNFFVYDAYRTRNINGVCISVHTLTRLFAGRIFKAILQFLNNNNNNNNNFICIAVYTKALYRFTIKKENN